MISETIAAILGVLTVVSTLASAVAVARASLAKSTIETLQQSNEALTERVGLLEAENGRQAGRLATLSAENVALQGYVAGTDAIKDLAAAMSATDRARQQEHFDILASIQQYAAGLVSSHEEVMALIRSTSHTHGAT